MSKTQLALACLVQPGYLVLLAALIYVLIQAHRLKSPFPDRKRQTLLMLLVAGTFIIAFIPPTLWRQYLAVPVPFLVLCLALPFQQCCRAADSGQPQSLKQAFIAVSTATCIAVLACGYTLFKTPLRLSAHQWEPIKLHRLSQDIAHHIDENRPILTLAPLYALEGGGTIYPELSCGSIVFRIGDLLTAKEQTLTHTVGPGSLANMIKQNPPAAILLGVETPGYEAPLRKLIDPSWPSVALGNGIKLFVPHLNQSKNNSHL